MQAVACAFRKIADRMRVLDRAKASSGRLAEVSPVAFLSCDLLEMVAAFLPRRVVWERVFELEAMTQQAADAADERAAGADDKGRVLS